MMNFPSDTKVYLFLGATDMRKAINGLSVIVSEQMQLDIFSSNLFVFCNRTQTILKILYWDKNGFCMWQKRLEKDRFKWPKTSDDVMNITSRELSWLVDGLNINQAHKPLKYSMIY
ncbi:IS66 family insertion sequence element accessory protein TnpB [Desulfobacula toluolica]|uniref:Putative transposase, IS66 Orf2 like n=1 Tax=Desulfobacula toluolica (strain DSM 7467 / Tol2) TaxID=651182 RepID=K0ND11_DESTT|nr:IS66 family insertion sequence element accessory protein TnpB [Desulfobacula toluolica]CCK78788.1 putative transposase, IS66 family [Desulfobacula toluolica Tol2]CCK78817.1 putative transposase, IS66 Orf2 like [Desulfobacula toluolica Tol2]CCK79133.1 transposase, IS66 family [Desulfobacula toluolica Tol2]CCK80021.1 putative transposase, IS66 Orf2 like [Desulfobacula toluolica Tol2]CCK80029.1 transposase, IS66 family [Desulfobacula toluolica Tol2]